MFVRHFLILSCKFDLVLSMAWSRWCIFFVIGIRIMYESIKIFTIDSCIQLTKRNQIKYVNIGGPNKSTMNSFIKPLVFIINMFGPVTMELHAWWLQILIKWCFFITMNLSMPKKPKSHVFQVIISTLKPNNISHTHPTNQSVKT